MIKISNLYDDEINLDGIEITFSDFEIQQTSNQEGGAGPGPGQSVLNYTGNITKLINQTGGTIYNNSDQEDESLIDKVLSKRINIFWLIISFTLIAIIIVLGVYEALKNINKPQEEQSLNIR